MEHDRAVRVMQALILSDAGYEVLEASNGFSGLRLARTHRPQVIVLDLVLPELAGCALIEALRTDALTANVPLVVVSAYADHIDPRVLESVHATLRKPFSVADLLTAVGWVLTRLR
jgi:CheY-like chemotaxis protein